MENNHKHFISSKLFYRQVKFSFGSASTAFGHDCKTSPFHSSRVPSGSKEITWRDQNTNFEALTLKSVGGGFDRYCFLAMMALLPEQNRILLLYLGTHGENPVVKFNNHLSVETQ